MQVTAARAVRCAGLTAAVGLLVGCSVYSSSPSSTEEASAPPAEETAAPRTEDKLRADPPDVPVDPASDLPMIEVLAPGGFDPLASLLPTGPSIVVYADGLMVAIAQGDPESLVPAYTATRLGTRQLNDLIGAARDAGLLGPDVAPPDDEDAWGMVTLTLRVDGETYVHHASTITSRDGEPVDPVESPVMAFLESAVAPLVAEAGEPYEPHALAVAATWGIIDNFSDEPMDPLPEWPLDESLATMSSCRVVEGADVDAVEAAAHATPDAFGMWVDDGMAFLVSLRPLMPHEADCPG